MQHTIQTLKKSRQFYQQNPDGFITVEPFSQVSKKQFNHWFVYRLFAKMESKQNPKPKFSRKRSYEWIRLTERLAWTINGSRQSVNPQDIPAEYRKQLSHRIRDRH